MYAAVAAAAAAPAATHLCIAEKSFDVRVIPLHPYTAIHPSISIFMRCTYLYKMYTYARGHDISSCIEQFSFHDFIKHGIKCKERRKMNLCATCHLIAHCICHAYDDDVVYCANCARYTVSVLSPNPM